MNSKMFASLEDVMKKWVGEWVKTNEWENLDFYCPEDIELDMAKAATLVFDATVKASKFSEESANDNK